MKHLRWQAALAALTLLFPVIGSAQQLPVIADTELSSLSPTKNFGTSPTLAVDSAHSVLLNFDLANLLPAGVTASQVNRARLILFPNTVTTKGSFKVVDVSGSWSEGAVTYSTRPALSSGSTTASVTTAFTYVEVPLLALVQTWITTPSSNHGIELQGVGSTSFILDSKENTATSRAPSLLVDVTGPVGPAGPPGPKGATGATGPQGPAGPSAANHDSTLIGTGTTAAPLGIAVPLTLNSNADVSVLTLGDSAIGGHGLTVTGGPNASGIIANGGPGSSTYDGGDGIDVYGGGGSSGGAAIYAIGGSGSVYSGGYGIVAYAGLEPSYARVHAAYFGGNVTVSGSLSKAGGSFKIDDPLDPANKYLSHSFVESPDMMNVYNGNIVTDGNGMATVSLPDWFDSLNRDFRYQLTVIGQFAQAIVESEIAGNRFTIRTDKPNVKVSWQVTGIRQDPWANAHRIPVEEEKPEKTRGFYLHPELYNQPIEKSVDWAERPELMREMAERSKQ
jgi:hypothetical protein